VTVREPHDEEAPMHRTYLLVILCEVVAIAALWALGRVYG
jgi:hypothetical protein